jgi:hypothetical protein
MLAHIWNATYKNIRDAATPKDTVQHLCYFWQSHFKTKNL